MPHREPRNHATPSARWRRLPPRVRGVILLSVGLAACAVMIAANPFAGGSPTPSPTSTSAAKTPSTAEGGPSTDTKDKPAAGEGDYDGPSFDGDADAIGAQVQTMIDSPTGGQVDTLGVLLYRYGDKDLADARTVFESIGAGETAPRVRAMARDWWSKATTAATGERLQDLKASAPGAADAADKAAALPGGLPKACSALPDAADKAVALAERGGDYQTLTDMQSDLNKAIQDCSSGMDADRITQVFGQQQGQKGEQQQ